MRLALTGGGTGGHIYPALEVGRLAAERGAEVEYLGSIRGMEGEACRRAGVSFRSVRAEPLYGLRSIKGLNSLIALARGTAAARAELLRQRPDVIFSTGGYSAAPWMGAARALGIPYTIHEANSVPGRSNRMFSRRAAAFTSTFRATERFLPGVTVERTGQPIRAELREAANGPRAQEHILVVGGSQGSLFLNKTVPTAAGDLPFLHLSGRNNAFEGPTPAYRVEEFRQSDAMAEAYRRAALVVGRSGGSCAEFAMFGLPAVLIPLPGSADDHQLVNAMEMSALGGADVLWQPDDARHSNLARADADTLRATIAAWWHDEPRRRTASHNLLDWDVPDATTRIVDRIQSAAQLPPYA